MVLYKNPVIYIYMYIHMWHDVFIPTSIQFLKEMLPKETLNLHFPGWDLLTFWHKGWYSIVPIRVVRWLSAGDCRKCLWASWFHSAHQCSGQPWNRFIGCEIGKLYHGSRTDWASLGCSRYKYIYIYRCGLSQIVVPQRTFRPLQFWYS